jgi:alkanesulfonate monooxygenase
MNKKEMKIAVLCNTAPFGWLKEGALSEGQLDFNLYRQLGRIAERGKLDILFLADGVGIKTRGLTERELEASGNAVHFEPTTLLGALSCDTQHVGLICTISTTYSHPYHIARQIGSLDFLSGGRSGWNVVTSGSDEEAVNFGLETQLDSAARYRRANESVDVVFKLWESFEADAFVHNRTQHRFFDASKMHRLKHRGEFFSVEGPLNMPRPPQGRPIISQAGASPEGHQMAARTADILYARFDTLEGGRRFRDVMHGAMSNFRRAPSSLAIMPGYFPIIGGTEREAQTKFMELQEFLNDEAGLNLIKNFWRVDLRGYEIDKPLPDLPEIRAFIHGEGVNLLRDGRRMTIREAFQWLASAFGHLSMIGTPEQVAENMALWFREGGADGFNLFLHSMPSSLDDFVSEVVPILRSKGLLKTDYRPGTLREKMGLSVSPSQQTFAA